MARTSNFAATQCDLLIAIGARFSNRVVSNAKRFAPEAQILHIDIDPAEINKNIRCQKAIIGDVTEVLQALNSKLAKSKRDEWLKQINDWKERFPLKYNQENGLKPHYVIEKIYELTGGDAIATEVGQHQI